MRRRPWSWRLLGPAVAFLLLSQLPWSPLGRWCLLGASAACIVASWVARWLEARAARRQAALRARFDALEHMVTVTWPALGAAHLAALERMVRRK